MSLEDFQKLGTHIETENVEERKEKLFEKINQISLVHADKKYQEIKKDKESYRFSEAVKEFAFVKNYILMPVYHLEDINFSEYQEKIDLFIEDVYSEIDSIYDAEGFDLEKISDLIRLKRASVKEYLGVENFKELERNRGERETKVLNYNQITDIETPFLEKYKVLKDLGFSKSDHFIEVHVENFSNTGEKSFGPGLIKSDFGVLAEHIIDKAPETAAIIGNSWLLDTPLADRLGFKKIGEDDRKQDDFSTWLQFIDKNGQIDQKRFNDFLKTGELPYKSVRAYMPVEEFLKRYLPENRRGKIVLKEINKDRQDFWERIKGETKTVKAGWDDMLKENRSFEDFIVNNKALNELLDFAVPDNKTEYLSFLKTMCDKKIPWAEFQDNKSENLKAIDEKIEQAMQADMFIDREIFVE